MEIKVLGEVELVGEAGPVRLSRLPRRLLAALTVEAGRPVRVDALAEALWGRERPPSAQKLLQVYVSQLRRPLGAPFAIVTESGAYRLDFPSEQLDASRFEQLVGEARAVCAEGNPALTVSLLQRALGLWRGPAYGDFAYEEFARAEADRLEELRLIAVEERFEAQLELGAEAEALPELERLAADQPLRERTQALLMRALYQCGRQSEALAVFTRTRARLIEDLGLEPAEELRSLQHQILDQDPALAPASTVAPRPPRSSLPAPVDELVGRERELAEMQRLLLDGGLRLIVLVGAGGSGKTRLALEAGRKAAQSFANGAVFVDLASVREPGRVPGTIAAACGFELPGERTREPLFEALRTRELLLLLDNAEHLLAAAPLYTELLKRAPRLSLLVTSRVVLHVSGEQVYPVEPLEPEAAAMLFRTRAKTAGAPLLEGSDDGEVVTRLCSRLDGLPLAIELAAARTRVLTPKQLLDRHEPALPLLAGGVRDLPARQQTLRATLDWSHNLLSRKEQQLSRRLSVFVGGFTLEAAEHVCEGDVSTVEALLSQSLLRRVDGERFAMLETIREYALERLEEAGEGEKLRRGQAEWCLRLAESANLAEESEGEQLLDLVASEMDNVRAAFGWCNETGDMQLGLELAVALEYFWVIRSPFEGMQIFETFFARAGPLPLALQARVLRAQAMAVEEYGDFERAESLYEQSLEAFQALADERGVAGLMHCLAFRRLERGETDEARELASGSVEMHRRLGNRKGEAMALGALGVTECVAGDPDRGLTLLEQSAVIAGEIGFRWWQGHRFGELGEQSLRLGRLEQADAWLRSAVELLDQVGDRHNVLYTLALLAQTVAKGERLYEAGLIWGAMEAEEERAPVYWWHLAPGHEALRSRLADPVLVHSGPEFDQGRSDGRHLEFDAALGIIAGGTAKQRHGQAAPISVTRP